MPERYNQQFWSTLDKLVEQSSVIIDRQRDTPHPEYEDMIYPLDYGYLAGTTSSDGAGIDIFQGSDGAAVRGVVCTVDLVKRDAEIKILLGCTLDEMQQVTAFLNENGLHCFFIRRSDGDDSE